jgi:hypothetical protein
VDISDFSVFQPKHVGIGPSIFVAKIYQTNDGSHIKVDNEAAVSDVNTSLQRRPARTGSLGIIFRIGICTTLKAGAGNTSRHIIGGGWIGKHIEISVGRFD